MNPKHIALFVVLLSLAPLTGCTSSGDGGGGSGAEISFTQDETNGIGVQVSDMGGYEAVWVEPGNVEGGFQINDEREVPGLYLKDIGPITLGDVCFKESHTAECNEELPDPEIFSEFDGGIEVYGLSGGEKTLIETREP